MALPTTPIEGAKWRIRQHGDSDWEGVIRLGKLHHGDRELADPRYAAWMSRCTFAAEPVLIVAEDPQSGGVIGFIWAIPFRAQSKGHTGVAYVGCNGLVHPDFRRTSIYWPILRMAVHATADGIYQFGFAKPNTVPHYRRVGMKLMTRMTLLVRPLDNAQLTRTRIANPFVRMGITLGWLLAGNTIYRPRGVNPRSWGLAIREESAFDESFDRFWEKVASKYDTMTVRDRAFLSWRFTGLGFRTYDILSARVGEEIAGYIVLRQAEFAGVRSGLICDLLVEPGERGEAAGLLLAREATRRFSSAGMALAGSLTMEHTEEFGILRKAGYVVCPERLAPQPFQVVVRNTNERITWDHLLDPTHWFLTMADHDAV